MKPSPGRIVHYVLPDSSPRKGSHRAAVVTSDWDGANINLNVQLDQSDDWAPACANDSLQKTGDFTARAWSAGYDESGKPGTWHWPERVD
jgi:hypothetical protein